MPLLKAILYQSMLAFLMLSSHFALSAQREPDRGYQLKAIFLYNFTQFVEWPPNTFASAQSPMVIGVLGSDPFGNYLEETIAGEKINGHPLQVKHYKEAEEITGCHVLFINLPETKRQQALTRLKGQNILTVSDDPDFMKRGGMIRFYTKEGKIKLQVNLEAAKTESLVLSSKLLRLVEIFTPQKG